MLASQEGSHSDLLRKQCVLIATAPRMGIEDSGKRDVIDQWSPAASLRWWWMVLDNDAAFSFMAKPIASDSCPERTVA